MNLLYRFLGYSALVGYRMSRYRVNFVGTNIICAFGSFIAAIILSGNTIEAAKYSGVPAPLDLATLFSKGIPANPCVSVWGRIQAKPVFELTDKQNNVNRKFFLMVDTKTRAGVIIDDEMVDFPVVNSDMTVAGVLRGPIDVEREGVAGVSRSLTEFKITT